MTNITITNARQNLYKIASSCIQYNDRINISTKDGNVVMISEDEYRSLLESLALAGIPGFYESIEEGVNTPLDECVKIEWK